MSCCLCSCCCCSSDAPPKTRRLNRILRLLLLQLPSCTIYQSYTTKKAPIPSSLQYCPFTDMFSSPRSRSSASGVPLGTPTRQTTAHTTGEDEAMVQSAIADDLQRSTPSKRPLNSLAATASSSSSAPEAAAASSPGVDRRKSPGASRSNTPRQGRSSTAASGSTPRKSRSSMVAAEAAPTEAADESTESQSGTANAALTAPIAESAAPEEVRLKRLEEALSRFLGLVDVRAT